MFINIQKYVHKTASLGRGESELQMPAWEPVADHHLQLSERLPKAILLINASPTNRINTIIRSLLQNYLTHQNETPPRSRCTGMYEPRQDSEAK